jgi:hypothetical protein
MTTDLRTKLYAVTAERDRAVESARASERSRATMRKALDNEIRTLECERDRLRAKLDQFDAHSITVESALRDRDKLRIISEQSTHALATVFPAVKS